MGHMCVTQSDTFKDTLDSDIVRGRGANAEVGDAVPTRLGYYNTKQLLQQIANSQT